MLTQDTAAAQHVMTLAAADPSTVAAAEKLEAAVKAVVLADYGSQVPAAITSAAVAIDVQALLQNAHVQGSCVALMQDAAAASGASWGGVAQVRRTRGKC